MEGTRNERAVLVVLAYIIGFTTAHIAITYLHEEGREHWQAAQPSIEIGAAQALQEPQISNQATVVEYNSGELLVHSINGTHLVSATPEAIGIESDTYELGIHESIPAYRLSPNKGWLHFCEVTSDPERCRHNIYNVNERVMYRVEVGGEHLITSVELAEATTWTEGVGLKVGPYHAESAAAPWELHAD